MLHNFIHILYTSFNNFMTNIVKEWYLNPMCKDKFHWTSLDKESSDDGLLKAETSNLELLYMCCVRLCF
jgi:hypothetical protein